VVLGADLAAINIPLLAAICTCPFSHVRLLSRHVLEVLGYLRVASCVVTARRWSQSLIYLYFIAK